MSCYKKYRFLDESGIFCAQIKLFCYNGEVGSVGCLKC